MNKILFVVIALLVLGGGFFIVNNDKTSAPNVKNDTLEKNESGDVLPRDKTEVMVTENETKVTDNNTVLNLSNQKLTSLPQNTFFNAAIQELNVSNNALTGSLPGEILFAFP